MRPQRVLLALALGLVAGLGLASADGPMAGALTRVLETVGTLWVGAIRMTVIPLVVSLLFVSVASVADLGALGRMGGIALSSFVLLLVASATAAALLVPPLLALVPFGPDGASAAGAMAADAAAVARTGAARVPGLAEWVVSLVPVNPIAAAADGALLPLVVFTLLLALAATRIEARDREALLGLFRGLRDALLVLVRWVIALAPIGVFALVAALVARFGGSVAGALGGYVVILSALLVAQAVVLYPLAYLLGGVPLRRFADAALPAQAVAISTRSSLAALPAAIEGAEQIMRVPQTVAGFVLPLAVSIFKYSAPLASVTGTLFVARLYQVDLTAAQVTFVAAAAVALSFSTPGIPAGNLVVLAPVFASLGLPLDGLGILIALDVIPDTVKTTGNVTANLAVTAIVARRA